MLTDTMAHHMLANWAFTFCVSTNKGFFSQISICFRCYMNRYCIWAKWFFEINFLPTRLICNPPAFQSHSTEVSTEYCNIRLHNIRIRIQSHHLLLNRNIPRVYVCKACKLRVLVDYGLLWFYNSFGSYSMYLNSEN